MKRAVTIYGVGLAFAFLEINYLDWKYKRGIFKGDVETERDTKTERTASSVTRTAYKSYNIN